MEKLTENQRDILKFLGRNPTASFQETAKGTSLNKGSVQRAIKALQAKGKLTRNQPVWIVNE